MSSNRWEAQQETKERAHNNAVKELARSRHWAKEYLTEAEVEGVPAYQTVINPIPPTPGFPNGSPEYRPPPWADSLRGLHAATLEFWTELSPYKNRVSKKWSEVSVEIAVPTLGDWDEQHRRFNENFKQRGIRSNIAEITMEDLADNWRFQSISLQCIKDDDQLVERQEKIYLPPAACRVFYEAMNDALLDLGLLAEVREAEGHATDPGVPDDFDAWGVPDGDR